MRPGDRSRLSRFHPSFDRVVSGEDFPASTSAMLCVNFDCSLAHLSLLLYELSIAPLTYGMSPGFMLQDSPHLSQRAWWVSASWFLLRPRYPPPTNSLNVSPWIPTDPFDSPNATHHISL